MNQPPSRQQRRSRVRAASTIARWVMIGILLPGGLAVAEPSPPEMEQQAAEYEVKAQFVERFTRFVRWPEVEAEIPLDLCIFGRTEIRGALADAVEESPVEIRRIEELEEVLRCDILFVGALPNGQFGELLEEVRGEPILTVGDREGLASAGLMINLFVEDGRVGFEVNEGVARESGLTLGSQLLRLARLVEESGPEGRQR